MQERDRIRQLFERYQQGGCTPEEEARLQAWFNRYAGDEAFGLDELRQKYEVERTYRRRQWLRWLPHAAVLAITLSAIGYFWSDLVASRPTDSLVTQSEDIAPGGNRATLTLADGRMIKLSNAESAIVVGGEGIAYEEGEEELVNLEADQAVALVLSTPKGGTYQVILSDGTQVWLNATSTLRYPSHFVGNQRIVEIEGEGYFQVAKDSKRPFRVISNGQEIEVLGTEFNTSAYPDENEVRTTLVEGSVQLKATTNNTQLSLVPGEQGVLSGATMKKQVVDVGSYIAWKDGNFRFDNTPLAEMMRQMSRWYAVDVVYEGEVPKELFNGTMSRNVTLQTVLELLRISEIKYRIQGNKLIIE